MARKSRKSGPKLRSVDPNAAGLALWSSADLIGPGGYPWTRWTVLDCALDGPEAWEVQCPGNVCRSSRLRWRPGHDDRSRLA